MQGLSVPFACIGSSDPVRVLCLYTMNTLDIPIMQGLFVPFACVGSGDPVRVLRLYTMNTLDIL